MSDITITKKRQKTELVSLLVCFIIAFCLNVYAIIAYEGEWNELFWSLGFVALTTALFYAVWVVVRIVIYMIKKLYNTKR